jgi:hypothetical protein
MVVTIPQSGPVLNPHGPELRKQLVPDSTEILANGISAGQAMIMMCPRTKLNHSGMRSVPR